MARRKRRESSAIGHGTPPLMVGEMNPIADHPGLGPLEEKRVKRIAGRAKGRAHVKVAVHVEAKAGKGDDGS